MTPSELQGQQPSFQPISRAKLYVALNKVQAALKPAIKDSSNPFFKSKYADLPSVWTAAQELLAANGLCLIQMPVQGPEGQIGLTTILAHTSGEEIMSTMYMKPVKNDPQGLGSCITYMRRYAMTAFLGIVQDDDDANVASGKAEAYKPKASFRKN